MIRLMKDEDDYAGRLFDEVPPDFFVYWLRYLAEAYRIAYTSSLDYRGPEGTDLLGYIRRARAEEALVQASLDAGLSCHSRKNKRRTSRHRVTLAGRFVLVQCHSACPGEIIRNAEHRTEYASLANGDLFEGFAERLPVPPEETIFAILQHGAHPKLASQLGFAVVNFPNADVDRYVSTVDLLKRFRDDQRVTETRIPGALPLRPKKRPDAGEDA